MQQIWRTLLLLSLTIPTIVAGFFFGPAKAKCPLVVVKAKAIVPSIVGNDLHIMPEFISALKRIDKDIGECKIHIKAKESLIKTIPNRSHQPHLTQLLSGHGFHFELRAVDGRLLCNEYCLSKGDADKQDANLYCLDNVLFKNGLRRKQDVIYDEYYDPNNQRFSNLTNFIAQTC
ncbi:hypothetical protein ACOME3_002869 [Neoechinorhynchus agilis]